MAKHRTYDAKPRSRKESTIFHRRQVKITGILYLIETARDLADEARRDLITVEPDSPAIESLRDAAASLHNIHGSI